MMPATPTIVFENGTMLGAMSGEQRKLQPPSAAFVIPEIVISGSQSSNSLNRSRNDVAHEEMPAECTALLEQQLQHAGAGAATEEDNEFDQFILNRTTSESNMLESSIYSELQFTTSNNSPAPPATQSVAAALNTSACSRSDSRQSKRTRRKLHKSKSKCSNNVAVVAGAGATTATTTVVAPPVGSYPPQYTAIFLDHHQAAAAAAANAAAASPFLSASNADAAAANYLQYHQYYQQRPMGMGHPHQHPHHHHLRRTLLDVAVPLAGGSGDVATNLASTNVNLNMSGVASANGVLGSSELSAAPLGYSFRKWFARPSLPFVIGIFALGGVACTLGGIVLGSTGLIEHSTQYLSAALLMIGIGVSLLVISGAIWRLSLPDDVDDCPCFRRMETCRNCNSPHCTNRLLPGSYLYPEFQHRPPPPSYLTSLNEYAFVYHPSAHPQQAAYATVRMNTPPPLYRSTYSLNTSTSHVLGGGVALPPTSEQPAEEQLTVLCTREAISQTSFKELEIDELHHEEPPTREAESQTLFKEVELD
ncbi:uncharacterized protein LOC132792559 isoform X1 [Drosophila nasuta]|uniref:Uncharacterized protein LOC117571886 isoform X1 n=1 Tax=Drosophila albomicans TaxID=7291 RepID=A0A6P8XDD7_DROAB|nr:uncharacterized protein LOC117571886 isoform X1 [Drosophila albomicans]XP_060657966.1 uncharacterized protein LOC132792559 isoform X1 [Drosophila nasuta]